VIGKALNTVGFDELARVG